MIITNLSSLVEVLLITFGGLECRSVNVACHCDSNGPTSVYFCKPILVSPFGSEETAVGLFGGQQRAPKQTGRPTCIERY